jgi:predicted Fe-Mo cluster-binding NifX family protein
MKVCITSVGADVGSLVDPRFGRATCLLLVDTETEEVQRLEGATNSPKGAGVLAAQSVVDSGAAALITGRIGPKAFDVLATARIPVYLTAATTVTRAIGDLTSGLLEQIDAATVTPGRGRRS